MRSLEIAAGACRARIRRRQRTFASAPAPWPRWLAWGTLALLAWRGLRRRRGWRGLVLEGACAWLGRTAH